MGGNNLEQVFSLLDTDKDGAISNNDFLQSFNPNSMNRASMAISKQVIDAKTLEEIDQNFKEIDKNGDGLISFEEFKDHIMDLRRRGRYD